jgi:uncharacterized repeat protein (TIGR01451 family)
LSIGEIAEFHIEVANTGGVPATRLKVVDHYDPSLEPTNATIGWKWTGADMVWEVDELAPGQTIRFQVNCKCLAQAAKSCNRATVSCQEGAQANDDACLAISPPPGGISVVIAEDADPVTVEDQATYNIRVTNHGQTSDRQVVLVVTVPAGMFPLHIGTQGPGTVRTSIDGQTVRFDPIAEMKPGDRLDYKVKVRAEKPGAARCRAQVTSQNLKSPVVVEETTQVIQGRN